MINFGALLRVLLNFSGFPSEPASDPRRSHALLWTKTVPVRTDHLRVGNHPAGEFFVDFLFVVAKVSHRSDFGLASKREDQLDLPGFCFLVLHFPAADGCVLLHPQCGPD